MSGRVRIKGEDNLAQARIIAHHAPNQSNVINTESRAAGCHSGRNARKMRGHDVGVALDHDNLTRLCDISLGKIEAVKNLCLVIHRSLRRIEILWPGIIVAQFARTKADGLTGHVPNWPDQALPKAVIGTLLSLREESGLKHLFVGETFSFEVVAQAIPSLGGKANAELVSGLSIESALSQKRAPDCCGWQRQLAHEELSGSGVRAENPRARSRFTLSAAPVFVVQFESHAFGKLLDGFGKAQVLHFLEE